MESTVKINKSFISNRSPQTQKEGYYSPTRLSKMNPLFLDLDWT